MKVKDKIILNKTLYQIRSLSDIERQKLGIFLKENIEKTVSFIATELFTYIYGRLPQNHVFYPLKIKNDLTFMFNNLKQYGIKGHYEFIPDKAQQIEYNKYSQLHRTAVLLAEMPAHEFDDYLNDIIKPSNTKEKIRCTLNKKTQAAKKSLHMVTPHLNLLFHGNVKGFSRILLVALKASSLTRK